MTEQELRRTAVIIPPSGRAVLCVWAAVPGLFAAPFVFWQSLAAGAGFCLLWAALLYCLWARACSFAAVLGARTVTVYSLSLIHISEPTRPGNTSRMPSSA